MWAGHPDRVPPGTLASRGLEEPAHASRGLEEPFFQLCCCVSFWFWWKIDFGCTYYYVLGVPYSCGVVLVFLVLVGNSFWCYNKHSFTPYPSLSPYSQMDRMTDGGTNTLAACGLEEIFSSCAVVSVFWFLAGNRFWCYLLTYLEYNRVVALC